MGTFALACILFGFGYWMLYKIYCFLSTEQSARYERRIHNDICYASDGIKEREIRFERFTAWAECPRCLTLDLHSIKDTLPTSCRRQCTHCNKIWRQT